MPRHLRAGAIVSTTRRTRGVWSTPRPLGPNGEKLCYNCHKPLPKGRTYNCSPECSEEWRTKTSPSYMRAKVWGRDHGVCALCRLDTDALQKEYRALPRGGSSEEFYRIRRDFRRAHGIPAGREASDWWDADHIVPVIEGGGECGLSNYRTLCIPCHQKVTKEMHARGKEKRKEQRIQAVPLPLFDQEEENATVSDTSRKSLGGSASSLSRC